MSLDFQEERARLLEEATAADAASPAMEDDLRQLEEAYEDEEEEEDNFCVACNRQLRSDKAYAAHLRQKRHLENVRCADSHITFCYQFFFLPKTVFFFFFFSLWRQVAEGGHGGGGGRGLA